MITSLLTVKLRTVYGLSTQAETFSFLYSRFCTILILLSMQFYIMQCFVHRLAYFIVCHVHMYVMYISLTYLKIAVFSAMHAHSI